MEPWEGIPSHRSTKYKDLVGGIAYEQSRIFQFIQSFMYRSIVLKSSGFEIEVEWYVMILIYYL